MGDTETAAIALIPSTEELLARIRGEARYLELDDIDDSLAADPAFPVWDSGIREFPLKSTYHISEFTVYEDIEFVVNAYRGLLGREIDESGLDGYVIALRTNGPDEKVWIVIALLESAEGRAGGVRVRGVRWERLEYRHGRKWWWRWSGLHWCNRLLLLAREFQRDGLHESLRENAARRDAFERGVDRFLSRQQVFFDGVHARQQQLRDEQEHMRRSADSCRREMLAVRQDLLAQQRRLNVLLADLQEQVVEAGTPMEKKARLARHAGEKLDAFYFAFENECRGDEAQIREQQTVYLPRLKTLSALTDARPLLDIGCGRGEWLSLLRDEGVPARGVDISRVLAEHCRQRNLDVELAEAIDYLRRLDDGCLGAISSFHLIEHLPFESLFSLVEESHRVLAPGGMVIFETPNPENVLVGSHTFYHDPTHRNPITPTLIDFLLRHLGFDAVEIERLHPCPDSVRVPGIDPLTDRVNGAFCGAQDFAVIARRPQ